MEPNLFLDLDRIVAVANTAVKSEAAFLDAFSSMRNAPAASLNATALWVLICYYRHLQRQEWVADIVASVLGGDLDALGTWGALAHPEGQPPSGMVPGQPQWSYHFHGRGCCLTHENGTKVDVDFNAGRAEVIDPWFYLRFLQTLPSPPLPESRLIRCEPMAWFWLSELPRLRLAGYLTGDYLASFTTHGRRAGAVLGGVAAKLEEEQDPWQKAILAAALNDFGLALNLLPEGSEAAACVAVTFEERLRARAAALEARVDIRSHEEQGARNYLYEKAEMGRSYVEEDCRKALTRRPIDRGVTFALQLIESWADSRFEQDLLKLLESCGGHADPAPLARSFCCRILMGYYHPDLLPATARNALLKALNREGRADAAEHAFLLYLLDKQAGLTALRRCLSHEAPNARYEACGALALIGSAEAMRVLKEVGNPEAMAGLSIMNDIPLEPLPDPEGKLVEVSGKQREVYSMDEILASGMPDSVRFACERYEKKYRALFRAYCA